MRIGTVGLLALTIGSWFNLAAEVAFTRFLIPLYAPPAAGAYGSVWIVDTWIHNSGAERVDVVPRLDVCRITCSGIGQQLIPGLAPSRVEPVLSSEAGLLMHVQSDRTRSVQLNSRVRDRTFGAASAGVEVPIVREDEFQDGPQYLLNVPLELGMRTSLRIYALPEAESPGVEVRYFRMPRQTPAGGYDLNVVLLRTDRVRLHTYAPVDGVRLRPSFALLSNVELLPELAGETSVWIEVAPAAPGLHVWALASATHNATQQVTLIAPRAR